MEKCFSIIRHRALRDRCVRARQLCFPTCCYPTVYLVLSFITSPLIRTAKVFGSRPPRGPALKIMPFVTRANIHYFGLWMHYIIHVNLNCCSGSNVLVTFSRSSRSCKSIISMCSFKSVTKRISKTIETRPGFHSKLIDLCFEIHLAISCVRHHVFIGI